MKRYIVCFLLLLALVPQMLAKHSDKFLIGTYTYYLDPFEFFQRQRETFARYMQEMGYNSHVMETNQNDRDLAAALETMDRYGIDAWIIDRAYVPDPKDNMHYSPTMMSTSSYQRYEAEYKDSSELNPGDATDSRFWYASPMQYGTVRTGEAVKAPEASNGYVWQTRRGTHKAGYAMADLTYRWKNLNGYNVRTGHEFQFYTHGKPNFEGENIWITYRFRISDVAPDTRPEDALITFQPAGYPHSPTGFAASASPVRAASQKGKSAEVAFTLEDYRNSKNRDGYMEYTIQVPYQELMDAGLIERMSRTVLALTNLNPRLYWHGNCTLDLDFVEMRDQISHELKAMKPEFVKGIQNRARDLINKGKGNVSGIYTFDEPHQAQFEGYRVIQDILSEVGIKTTSACYDYRKDYVIIDPEKSLSYDHLDSFLKQVQPKIFCPDIYPLLPQFGFNPGSPDKRFIQNVIDEKMLTVYKKGIQYKLEDPSRKFYPVVQAFGRWRKDDPDTWTHWVMPPYATQKALLYLPLAYGVDGVFHYRLHAFQTEDGYGDFVGLATYPVNDRYVDLFEYPITMDAIMHTNPKVKTYGEIIANLRWLDAHSVNAGITKGYRIPSEMMLKSLRVEEQDSALYSGYIQMGYYLGEQDNPWLIAVNRRGNYFQPGEITEEVHVHPRFYDQYYPQADPQTLEIEFSAAASRRFGKYIGLWDPYSGEVIVSDGKSKTMLELPAGEAGFYKMVQTLPAHLDEKLNLKNETTVYGDVVLEKGSKLIMNKKSRLILSDGAKLLVSPEAEITLAGTIELKGNAQMHVLGYMKNKNAKFITSEESVYLDESRQPRSFFKRLFGIK